MNRFIGRDVAQYKAIAERKEPNYYKNLVFKILGKMSQIRILDDESSFFHLDITYLHFRYFGDCQTFKFRAINIADAYKQYLETDEHNDLDLNLYINYHLVEVIQFVQEMIDKSMLFPIDFLKFDNLVAFLCLEEILYQFIDEWEPSLYIQKDSRVPIKCIGYSTTGLFLSEDEEKAARELKDHTDNLLTIYQQINDLYF